MTPNSILSKDVEVEVVDTKPISSDTLTFMSTLSIRLPLYRLQAILGYSVAIEFNNHPDLYIDTKHLHILVEVVHR